MTPKEEDATLLRTWAEGDADAGDRLVQRHFPAVYGFFADKAEDPEELVQKTFLKVLEIQDRYRASASFRAFVFGIARRLLLRYFRDRRRDERKVSFETDSIESLLPTPSRNIAGREEERLLLHALRKLPVDFQVTLELFYWENASVDEIAEVLEIRPGTVKSRLNRARGMLRSGIESMQPPEPLLRSTLDRLDEWAMSLRAALGRGVDPG